MADHWEIERMRLGIVGKDLETEVNHYLYQNPGCRPISIESDDYSVLITVTRRVVN